MERSLTAPSLLPRPGLQKKRMRDRREAIGWTLRERLRSLDARLWIGIGAGAVALAAVALWFLTSAPDRGLADLLEELGYREIAAPADFYVPGTIHTIETRADGKIALHPTCTIPTDLLAGMTFESRTVDRSWEHRLDKSFDVSAHVRNLLVGGVETGKVSRLELSLRNARILHATDEDLWRVQHQIIKDQCREAIDWNIRNGGLVCQTRAAMRGDLVYDIVYRDGVSVHEKGKLTAEVAASLKLDTDQQRADRMLGNGLIFGVKLMPAGIASSASAQPADCRVHRA